jgi:hypothetical protein
MAYLDDVSLAAVVDTALRSFRQLKAALQLPTNAPDTLKKMDELLDRIASTLTKLQDVPPRVWESFDYRILQYSKIPIDLCTKSCDKFVSSLFLWRNQAEITGGMVYLGSLRHDEAVSLKSQLHICDMTFKTVIHVTEM